MNLEEEKKLIAKAKKDPEAFGRLYNEYYSRIFGYSLKRVANIDIAKDITSETFIKALKNIWKFRWKNISFSSWLYRVASNEIVNYYRGKHRKTIPFDEIAEPASNQNILEEVVEAEEELKKHEDFLEIQEKIIKMDIKYQEVITLRFFEKKQIKEIVEILGKKEGTIKSLLHRGLEKLRGEFSAIK